MLDKVSQTSWELLGLAKVNTLGVSLLQFLSIQYFLRTREFIPSMFPLRVVQLLVPLHCNWFILNRTCVFCGMEKEEFLEQATLEEHYSKGCPMLHSCSHCGQVTVY